MASSKGGYLTARSADFYGEMVALLLARVVRRRNCPLSVEIFTHGHTLAEKFVIQPFVISSSRGYLSVCCL
ncbi:MAG: hypothetical protein ACLTCP_10995 [Ruminococcus bicirculans (ex Wegman et al. 2014)]